MFVLLKATVLWMCHVISKPHYFAAWQERLTGGFKPISSCWSTQLTTVKEEFLPNSN